MVALGEALRRAVSDVLADGRVLTADLGGTAGTDAVAAAVGAALRAPVSA